MAQAAPTQALRMNQPDSNDHDDDPENANWQQSLSISHRMIADGLKKQGAWGEALPHNAAAVEIMKRVVARDPSNGEAQLYLAISDINRATACSCRP